jgi:hypothetical protein
MYFCTIEHLRAEKLLVDEPLTSLCSGGCAEGPALVACLPAAPSALLRI